MTDHVQQNSLARGLPHPFPVPKFNNPHDQRKWMLGRMAGAFRIFGRRGYGEGSSGHISVKDPVVPGTYWINPLAKHFLLMKASDMVHIDEHCNILPDGNQAAVNAAGFSIHVAIHKARPDIAAACHTHSMYGKAYLAFGKPLEMLNQDACLFFERQAVYSDHGGIAFDEKEGIEIAEALGPQGLAAILQNHGLLTLGHTVDEAAYLFTLFENSCHAQILADSCPNHHKHIILDSVAAYTRDVSGDPDTLYGEFQPDFEYELHATNGDFLQ